MRFQCLCIVTKAVLAFIAARCNHEAVINHRCGVADDHGRQHADLVVKHLLERRDNGLLAVAVGAFYNTHGSGRITVAEQDLAGLFNLACALSTARIVKGNHEVSGRRRLHACSDALPRRKMIAQADRAGIMHNGRTQQRRTGLNSRYPGNHLDFHTRDTVPAPFDQHFIDQSRHSVYPCVTAGNDGDHLPGFRAAHGFLGPADLFGHACADNLLMPQQRLDQVHISGVADHGFTLFQRCQSTARNMFQPAWTKADNQQLSFLVHSCSPVRM
ncbi:hypothetical protein D3C73_491430 [compost metagenome]